MAGESTPKAKRARARTHRNGARSEDFEADILRAAEELFESRGYAQTSMSAIARAVGIDQSSLYYWFSSKDDLLEAMLEKSNLSMRFADVSEPGVDVAAYLYALSYRDTYNLCAMPVDYFELEQAAIHNRERFEGYFAKYRQFASAISAAIDTGCAQGNLICDDSEVGALSFLLIDEGVQHRFHQNKKGFDPFGGFGRTDSGELDVSRYAHVAARDCLSMFVERLDSIELARSAAQQAGWLDVEQG